MNEEMIKKMAADIADFMEWEKAESHTHENPSKNDKWLTPHEVRWMAASWMKFHISMDWLMPVVQRIAKLGFRIEINIGLVDSSVFISIGEDRMSFVAYSKLTDALLIAVHQFVTWYKKENMEINSQTTIVITHEEVQQAVLEWLKKLNVELPKTVLPSEITMDDGIQHTMNFTYYKQQP